MSDPDVDHAAPPGEEDGGRLGFKSHLRATLVPGEAAYLVSHRGVTALHGPPAEVLVPLLDGSRDPAAVVRESAPSLMPEEARASLRALDAAGLLRLRPAAPDATHGSTHGDPAAEAYWDLAGLDGGQVPHELSHRTLRVVAPAGLDTAEAEAACAASGLALAAPGEDANLTLVLCEDYLSPWLRETDTEHRAAGRPWLLTGIGSTASWVGPVFQPHDGACWHCLATRLRGHRRSEEPLRRALALAGPPTRPAATLPAGRSLTVHLAVLEAAKWLAGVRNDTQRAVHVFDTLRFGSTSHPVSRLPQCPACGDPGLVARRAGRPFVARSRPKTALSLNSHRALPPAEMLRRYAPLVDPVTGIVREIRRAPGSPGFVDAFVAGENLAMRSPTLAGLRAGLRSLSGGKGLSEEEARTSALGEAVERYSGTRQGDEPVVRDTYRALGPATALHPNAYQLYSEAQFARRDAINARADRLQYVPPLFDEDLPTDWTPVWSLTHSIRRLVPTSLLYFSEEPSPDGLFADSNGNAAGSSPEDALVQGFLELVERDAVALWWYNRTRRPGIDLDAFDEPYIGQLREGYRSVSREIWALDLTSDFGIPVVAALSRRTDKPAEDIVFGFGAHFDPRLALRRALTEMGQLLPLVAAATPEGTGYRVTDPEPLDWWLRATATGRPYLRPDSSRPRGPADRTYVATADLREDVKLITDTVRARGMELLVLDQTRPDLELPVVKVMVPGLRHFWPRFAPGRLFDTPVTLGHLALPTPYEQLNPVPLFI